MCTGICNSVDLCSKFYSVNNLFRLSVHPLRSGVADLNP